MRALLVPLTRGDAVARREDDGALTRWVAAVEAARDAIVLTDRVGMVLAVSEPARILLRMLAASGQPLDRVWHEITSLPPQDLAQADAAPLPVRVGRQQAAAHTALRLAIGTAEDRLVQVLCAPITGDDTDALAVLTLLWPIDPA